MSSLVKESLLKDQVCNRLADMIANAELLPGDRLTERQIADKLGVSLTPVREALIKLSSDGIIYKIPHKGFYVKKYSDEEIKEVYEVFVSLQELAIRILLNQYSDECKLVQENIILKMELAFRDNDYKSYLISNHKLHDYYIYASKNNFLISMYKNICRMPIPIFYVAEDNNTEEIMRKGISDHRKLMLAIENKNSLNIRKILLEHYDLQETLSF